MKVTFLTEGGRNIGFGHLARCIALSEAFEEQKIFPEFIVNGDPSARGLLKEKNFRCRDWRKNKTELIRAVQGAGVLIIDSYLAGRDLYGLLPGLAKTAVYFDDNARLDYPDGIVINGNLHAQGLGYPSRPGLRCLLGTRYLALRRPFWDMPEKKIPPQARSVILTFGGDDLKNLSPAVIRLLNREFPALKKTVVIGKAYRNAKEIKKQADKNTRLAYYPDAEKMKELMLEADLAVSSAGQTLYELARSGVAVAAISVSDDQQANLDALSKIGFLESCGRSSDRNWERTLADRLKGLLSFERRKKALLSGQKLVDGQGARRAVKKILSS